jgi:hypothetical protein
MSASTVSRATREASAGGRHVVAADSGRYVRVWPGAIVPPVRMSARRPPRWMSPLSVPGWVRGSR